MIRIRAAGIPRVVALAMFVTGCGSRPAVTSWNSAGVALEALAEIESMTALPEILAEIDLAMLEGMKDQGMPR